MTIERTEIVLTDIPIPDLLAVSPVGSLPPNPPIWIWSLWIFPPIITFFIWLFARPKRERRQDVAARKPRKKSGNRALSDLRNRLQKAQAAEPKAAYQQIMDGIYAYLGAKTGRAISEANAQEAMAGFPTNYRDVLLACLEEASAGQYAPVTLDDVRNLSQRVLRVCVAIEKAS